jgi:hypothetical protein
MDALRGLYDPEAIARSPEGWPEQGPSVGREAVMRGFDQLRETWDVDAFDWSGRRNCRFPGRTTATMTESGPPLTLRRFLAHQRSNHKNAAMFCKAERAFLGDLAFARKY